MKKQLIALTGFIILLSGSISFAAEPAITPIKQIVIPPRTMPLSNFRDTRALELQLKNREIQLEEELLDIKKQLLLLKQQERITPKTAINAPYHFKSAKTGKIPAEAIVAATVNNQPVYVCHSDYLDNTIQPGQVTDKGCLISYGGRAINQTQYKILTGKTKIFWQSPETLYRYQDPMDLMNNPMSRMPVIGGYEKDHNLYICRAMYQNQIHVGKVVADNCNISIAGSEVRVPTYEVLFVGN